ncbi:hypothetical protein PAPHI01_1155 [Pancytospora philotis]|nr:hypothetical protein PAPHI01_1155 [Pancytospora philotis]
MRILTAALPLAGSFARARVGLKQAIRAVTSSHGTASGDRLFVSPEGPLNILRGHLAVNNDVIAKKRLFSPPIHIYYALEEIKKNETDQTEESGTVSEQHMVSTPMHTNYALEETRKHKTDPAVKPDADSEEHSLSPPVHTNYALEEIKKIASTQQLSPTLIPSSTGFISTTEIRSRTRSGTARAPKRWMPICALTIVRLKSCSEPRIARWL